jgi:hypothetical protein
MEVAMSRLAGILISVALAASTIGIADGAPLHNYSRHAHHQNRAGYAASTVVDPGHAASPVDMGAQCRAQVREIWPTSPTMQGGGERPIEMLFDVCMSNGGRIP